MKNQNSHIPFNKPFIAGKELYYISQAVIKSHLSGDGYFTERCHKWLEKQLQCSKALLTHSCTGALEMAAMLCDIQPGDEVIMPSFTFVSTANAFVLRGATPVFVDIRPDTLNIDENKISDAITSKTKAIVPVHYAGVPCDMNKISDIAKHYDLYIIEDAAQALLSKYKEKFLGTIGHLGCLSFHETKNIISGEGGALLINDHHMAERSEIIREKGTNRKQFFKGFIDKYTWVDMGSSFLPSELVGAFLFAQFEMAEKIIESRRNTFKKYLQLLKPIADTGMIQLPYIDELSYSNGHIVYILAKNLAERDRLITHLFHDDIHAVFHYIPLHSSPAGLRFGKVSGSLQVTDEVSDRIIRLPIFYEMRDDQVERVVTSVNRFYELG